MYLDYNPFIGERAAVSRSSLAIYNNNYLGNEWVVMETG